MKCVELMFLVLATAVLGSTTANAGSWSPGETTADCRHSSADFCATREINLKAREMLDVDGAANGSIQVRAWDKDEISIRAEVSVHADGDEERAENIAREIDIETSGTIKAAGPRRTSWSVSYDVMVPRATDLRLRATNGGISIAEVRGDIDAKTTNGGLHLSSLAGDVRGRTTNGGLHIELSGKHWSGKGLDARSTNGGANVLVPENYSADLSLSTVNGEMHLDFPVTVSGQIDKKVHAKLGKGGAPIKVQTTNGGVHLYRD